MSRSTDAPTGDETESFDSIVEGIFNIGAGPESVTLTGPVQVRTLRKGTSQTGTFDTEILSMSLSGDVGGVSIEIRESPSRRSPGTTRVDDIGNGLYEIDSFFDVFTELSVDGGAFQPQTNEAARVDLPEPNQLLMLLSAIPMLRWMVRRRGRS